LRRSPTSEDRLSRNDKNCSVNVALLMNSLITEALAKVVIPVKTGIQSVT